MAEPPRGTVTLLFTDIAGSTHLWQQHGDLIHTEIARHDALLKTVVESYGGTVFKTVGDGVCAAFATTPDALQAALAIQRAVRAEDWGLLGELHIRVALHTGIVETRDGDYFGLALSRTARLLAAGHGGQILLSLAAHELTYDSLPPEVTLRDLGRHQLKDLARPEQIFQAVAPDLPAAFPPLSTLNHRPQNLPVQTTPLVGRAREIAQGLALLARPEVRLLTLTGPGGVGKTRLALQLAAELAETHADGAWFVNLAPVSDPALVLSTIAQTLGVREAGAIPLMELLIAHLRERELLLLLDNFEQVVAAADVVATLLAAAPHLTLLVTSRTTLRLYGEHEYAVPPLSLPEPKQLPSVERLTQYEAVRLFIERARAARADFTISDANAPAVAEICARLDGLPLALELAAARIKLLAPEALLQRLERRLALLTGGPRDLPARQQTLRNTIDWSYNLLEPAEQRLFARLGVFVGGCTLEAVETVCNTDGELGLDTLDGVASLLDKSLLRQEEGPGGEPRFLMLETLHEYAREKLEASGEAETMRGHHAHYLLAFAQRAEPELYGPRQEEWLDRLEVDHDNLRAAVQWAISHKQSDQALQLGAALGYYWGTRGYLNEGRRWLEEVLAVGGANDGAARGKVLFLAGNLALFQGDYDRAEQLAAEGEALGRATGDTRTLAYALNTLGNIAGLKGEHDRATACYEESLPLMRLLGDSFGIQMTVTNLGWVATNRGDYARAIGWHTEALALAREQDDRQAIAMSLSNLGLSALSQGRVADALPHLQESLALDHQLGNTMGLVFTLEGIAGVAALSQSLERAAQLWGAADAARELIGVPIPPVDQAQLTRMQDTVRAGLGHEAWHMAYQQGQAMPLDEAVALALEPVPAAPPLPVPPPTLPGGLSEREAEVLGLVAQGLTNAQIAERLVLSPFTVNAHLRTIYGKIGVNTRAAATRWASDNRLV